MLNSKFLNSLFSGTSIANLLADTQFVAHLLQVDAALAQFKAWTVETDLALTAEERAFLDAYFDERTEAQEAERQAKQQALERRSQRFLRMLVGVLPSMLSLRSDWA